VSPWTTPRLGSVQGLGQEAWTTFGENRWTSLGENGWPTLDENTWTIIARKMTCAPPWRKITNPNTNYATWSATAIDDWLSISGPEGYTPSSAMVSIDTDSLPDYGVYTTTIIATSTLSNCVKCQQTIPVTANYASQCWRSYLPLLFKES